MSKEKFCFLPGFKKDKLPAPGHTGRLARVTDDGRGIWMDQGEQWFALNGNAINVMELGARTDDSQAFICSATPITTARAISRASTASSSPEILSKRAIKTIARALRLRRAKSWSAHAGEDYFQERESFVVVPSGA